MKKLFNFGIINQKQKILLIDLNNPENSTKNEIKLVIIKMIWIKIIGCSEKFGKVHKLEFAEILHDTFHYNVPKAKEISNSIAEGKEVTLSLPFDCDIDKVLLRIREFGIYFIELQNK